MPPAAGVAVIDRGALAGDPGREHDAPASGRRRGGELGQLFEAEPGALGQRLAQPSQAQPGRLLVVGDQVTVRVQPGIVAIEWIASVFLRVTGSEIHDVVLIDVCAGPGWAAPVPTLRSEDRESR